MQYDWQLFSSDDPEFAGRFLSAVFPTGHRFLEENALVCPRYSEQGAAADHTVRWEAFCKELISVNRFFPAVEFDHGFLRDVIQSNLRHLGRGLELFRGRLCDGATPWPVDQMGTAPERKVPAGRGNPVGIPHLYLASDLQTCLKESRALQHGFVSVATFQIQQQVSYLDLAALEPRNPFVVADDSDLVEVLVSSQFLSQLGRELSKPTRPGENQLEYVPTQYLCEFVKATGVGGIRYRSALHPDGWNIVLFGSSHAELAPPVRVYEVTSATFEFEER